MKITCLFRLCKWVYIGKGFYQCSRCKTISLGSDRNSEANLNLCRCHFPISILNRLVKDSKGEIPNIHDYIMN